MCKGKDIVCLIAKTYADCIQQYDIYFNEQNDWKNSPVEMSASKMWEKTDITNIFNEA